MSGSNGKQKRGEPSIELPLASLPKVHPCSGCGACCKYIALEIDDPETYTDYDHTIWYLVHENVAVYIDFDNDWFVEFTTRCENLTEDVTCGDYENRPKICSDFSWEECEPQTGESAWKFHFSTPQELLAWMEKRRPRAYAKYLEKNARMKDKRQERGKGKKAEAPKVDEAAAPA